MARSSLQRLLRLTLLTVLIPAASWAQGAGEHVWFPGGTYDPAIPTPKSVLGYEIGEAFTFHHRMKAYMETVAEASDRVVLQQYGVSNEGRELLMVIVSSPANLSRLEEIRASMARLADPRGASQAELDRTIADSPAIAWLSYNVHGNESTSTEAAIQVVYQLAAGTDAVTRNILDEMVVVIDPLQNPDGRDRYVASFTKRVGERSNPSSEAWEHSEDWPGGRTNHYYFDLNRDWAWQTQVETKQRVAEYLKWNPVVHVDFHEMGSGSSYFFFPADKPVHGAFPDEVMKWQKIYGQANAAAFDQFGWPYYTRQTFDLYYPSYGDSWPSMMGAIGMTYEQGGGGGAGVALERSDGFTLTLRFRSHGHFTTSMATLRITAERRQERLRDFLDFFRAALAKGDGPIKTYALEPDQDGWRAERLVRLLRAQGIEVSRADASFRARVSASYGTGRAPDQRQFPAGTWLVEAGQPKGIAVQMLLEPRPALEDTSFYDLSAWSLPMAFNVEAWGLGESPRVGRIQADQALGMPRAGSIQGGRGSYGYVIPYDGMRALLTVVDLLNDGVRVTAAGEEFGIGGRGYPKGSFVIPAWRNPQDLHDRVQRAVTGRGVTAWAISTGLVESGPDLGGSAFSELKKPRIAVAGGEDVGSGSFGEVWNFFDQQYPLFDFTIVEASRLGGAALDDYNVLILPSASYSRSLSEATTDAIRSWAQAGGVVIGFGGGAQYAGSLAGGAGGAGGGAQAAPAAGGPGGRPQGGGQGAGGAGRPSREDADRPAVEARRTLAESEYERRLNRTPGGVYEVIYDPDHWLAFGQPERMAVIRSGGSALPLTTRGVNVAVFTREPLLSGYAAPDVPGDLAKQAWLIVENIGRGKAVMFADDPFFRLFVEGNFHPVLNAIVLGPGF